MALGSYWHVKNVQKKSLMNRKLSDITVQEGAALWDTVMPETCCPFRGHARKYAADKEAPERVCFMQGVERLGIYFDGHIWADPDLSKIEINQQKVAEYLARIGIEHLPSTNE
jgi:hypothetical protein